MTLTAMLDPIAYYNPEIHVFPAPAESFAATGALDPETLYLILDWKAPRARTRQCRRLAGIAGSFDAAVNRIAVVAAVRDAAPEGLSLRDCDRWLWGRDKRKTLLTERGINIDVNSLLD